MSMAGMFCSLEEAALRLGKSEEEIKDMIKQGTLREFRDGPNLLLKVDEIEEVAQQQGIEAPAEAPAQEAPPPTPLATVPTSLETEPEEDEMEEPEIPELESLELDSLEPAAEDEAALDMPELDSLEPAAIEEGNLDVPELGSFEEDMPDLELPELAAVDSAEEMPAIADDELLSMQEEAPAPEPAPAEKPKAKAKKKKTPKPKKQPRPRPVKAGASTAPGLSFGEWFVRGLRNDSIAAIIVLIMILGFVLATI
ncbi:MAG: helix-turn-helix domain-containing protein, partial [Planctomycetota bacterium]